LTITEATTASAELEYSGALQNLLPLAADGALAKPGTLLADYVQSLKVVREATLAVRTALEADPGSRYLNNMLTDLQHRQLMVLKEMAREADQQISVGASADPGGLASRSNNNKDFRSIT